MGADPTRSVPGRAGDAIGHFRCLLSGETQNSSKRPFSPQAAAGNTGWAVGTAGQHMVGHGGPLPTQEMSRF